MSSSRASRSTGFADALISQIEQGTGARVEMGGFHFQLWGLRAEIDNLTVHGLEAADQPPLFHADRIDVAIRILSFFGRQIALDELIVERPADGRANRPKRPEQLAYSQVPREQSPLAHDAFQLRIGQLALNDGGAQFNDQRTPLDDSRARTSISRCTTTRRRAARIPMSATSAGSK